MRRGDSSAKAVQKQFSGSVGLLASVVTLYEQVRYKIETSMGLPPDVFRHQRMGQSLLQSECLLCNRLIGISCHSNLLSLLERLHVCPDMHKSAQSADTAQPEARRRA